MAVAKYFYNIYLEDLLEHLPTLLQRKIREEMLYKVGQRHHEVVEHIWSARNHFNPSYCDEVTDDPEKYIALNLKVITRQDRAIPDIYARNNLLVDERLLQLVGLLVAFLNGELLDLS